MIFLVFFISLVHPLSQHRLQPASNQNPKFMTGIIALKKHARAIADPTKPYHSGKKSSYSPCKTGLYSGRSNRSLSLEFCGIFALIKKRMRAVLTNWMIHIFLVDAASRYVTVCLPSKADNSRKNTRSIAFKIAIEKVKP